MVAGALKRAGKEIELRKIACGLLQEPSVCSGRCGRAW
jgi:hypothetical protein